MYKKGIAIFFTLIIMAMSSVPLIIVAIDDTIDISMIFTLTEQEEKAGKEIKDIEVLVTEPKYRESESSPSSKNNNLGYFLKKYSKPHLNLISPPPQLLF